MSARRMKVKLKPNIGPVVKKKPVAKPKLEPPIESSSSEVEQAVPEALASSITDQQQQPLPPIDTTAAAPAVPQHAPLEGFLSPRYREGYLSDVPSPMTSPINSPPRVGFTSPPHQSTFPTKVEAETDQPGTSMSESAGDLKSDESFIDVTTMPERHRSPLKSPMMSPRRTRTLSENVQDLETEPKYARKVFKGDEELNTAAMTLSDLVSWNPRNEKKLKWLQDQKESKKEVKSELGSREESMTPAPTPQPDIAAPQIKINADGTLAIDEKSLIVRGNPEAKSTDWEVVDEDRVIKKISSTSFRKRVWRKGTPWSEQETDMFYEIIQSVGTDFSLMHQFFPSRARSELKSKYNFEKRRNSRRLDMALSNPSFFDESLQNRAETLATQVEEAREAKLAKKRSAKRVKFDDEDNESVADDVDEKESVACSTKDDQ